MLSLIALALFGGVAWYVTTPDERRRFFGPAVPVIVQGVRAMWPSREGCESFDQDLCARTRWVVVTPALAAVNIAVFVLMLVGPGSFSDPTTLVRWGANYAPSTTNGEWWRLLSSTFVHAGVIHVCATLLGLVPLGLVLERLVGPIAFAAVYASAGMIASVLTMGQHPLDVMAGGSAAICGLYGLLLGAMIWGAIRRTMLVPLRALRNIAPSAALFALHTGATDIMPWQGERLGFVVGLAFGVATAMQITERKPSWRYVVPMAAAAAAIVIALALPQRGLTDVRPELARVVAVETRTAGAYDEAVGKFRKGTIKAEALAILIDRQIMPELRAVRARLSTLSHMPHEHEALVASANEYLKLRDESWRLRAEGLRKSNLVTLRRAENTERLSLEALDKIKPSDP